MTIWSESTTLGQHMRNAGHRGDQRFNQLKCLPVTPVLGLLQTGKRRRVDGWVDGGMGEWMDGTTHTHLNLAVSINLIWTCPVCLY